MMQSFSKTVQKKRQDHLIVELSKLVLPSTISHQRRMFHGLSALPGSLIMKKSVHRIGIQPWSRQLDRIQLYQTQCQFQHSNGHTNNRPDNQPSRYKVKAQHSNGNTNNRPNNQPRYKDKHRKVKWGQKNNRPTVVDSEWVQVTGIPPLSLLEDILVDLERIMTAELEMGILDLDAHEKQLLEQIEEAKNPTQDPIAQEAEDWAMLEEYEKEVLTPIERNENSDVDESNVIEENPGPALWVPDSKLPRHMVVEAHPILSTLFRTSGWYLRFPNRSCVHALLSHIAEAEQQRRNKGLVDHTENQEQVNKFIAKPLKCAWKEVTVDSTKPNKSFLNKARKLNISDNTIRVENCCSSLTEDEIKYFFSSFTLTNGPLKAVEQVVKGGATDTSTPSTTSIFIVRFESPSDARAALREKQDALIADKSIRLVQYPPSYP